MFTQPYLSPVEFSSAAFAFHHLCSPSSGFFVVVIYVNLFSPFQPNAIYRRQKWQQKRKSSTNHLFVIQVNKREKSGTVDVEENGFSLGSVEKIRKNHKMTWTMDFHWKGKHSIHRLPINLKRMKRRDFEKQPTQIQLGSFYPLLPHLYKYFVRLFAGTSKLLDIKIVSYTILNILQVNRCKLYQSTKTMNKFLFEIIIYCDVKLQNPFAMEIF